MPVTMSCPGCDVAFSFSENLVGRTIRCKMCGEFLTVGSSVVIEELAEELDEIEIIEEVRLRKKKGDRKGSSAVGTGWKVALGTVLFVVFLGGFATLVVLSGVAADTGPNLVGEWKGAPQVVHMVNEALKDAPPLAKNFAGGILQKAADELLAMKIQFTDKGQVLVTGNTSCIGVAGPRDGRWQILEREGNILTVRLSLGGDTFDTRLAFRSRRNTFTLTRMNRNDQPVVFERIGG